MCGRSKGVEQLSKLDLAEAESRRHLLANCLARTWQGRLRQEAEEKKSAVVDETEARCFYNYRSSTGH